MEKIKYIKHPGGTPGLVQLQGCSNLGAAVALRCVDTAPWRHVNPGVPKPFVQTGCPIRMSNTGVLSRMSNPGKHYILNI